MKTRFSVRNIERTKVILNPLLRILIVFIYWWRRAFHEIVNHNVKFSLDLS